MSGYSDNSSYMVVNPGYASAQLAAAHRAEAAATTAQEEGNAAKHIKDWNSIVAGMASGTLAVGSRMPVRGLPVWVTLRVAAGGFPTGEALAEQPLQPSEVTLTQRAGVPETRLALNSYYATTAGLSELRAILHKGSYRLQYPEEAALPIVAWLKERGEDAAALGLLMEIQPFMGRLRFAPLPSDTAAAPSPPAPAPGYLQAGLRAVGGLISRLPFVPRWENTGAVVPPSVPQRPADTLPLCVATVNDAREALEHVGTRIEVLKLRESLTVWIPMGDAGAALWQELRDAGRLAGRVVTQAPAAWLKRAAAHVASYDAAATRHKLCKRHMKAGKNFATLLRVMRATVEAGGALLPGAQRQVAKRLDDIIGKRGRPGSDELVQIRKAQAYAIRHPPAESICEVILERMKAHDSSRGLPPEALATVLAPVYLNDMHVVSAAAGEGLQEYSVPKSIARSVRRALEAPLPELAAQGLVGSAETLAGLLPPLGGAVQGAHYRDTALGPLMTSHHIAFAARRSLLLLHYASQARVEELPWVAAVAPFAARTAAAAAAADNVISCVLEIYLSRFAGTLMPNPFIKELKALLKASGGEVAEVPLTEELAADIFMGGFGGKFQQAAQLAARLLRGSVYERYYGIDYGAVLGLPAAEGRVAEAFGEMCTSLASRVSECNSSGRRLGYVATNGSVIEQAQILTTHNLAALVECMGARCEGTNWADAATGAFDTVLKLASAARAAPGGLQSFAKAKQAAFAWRHVVFFLAVTRELERGAAILELQKQLEACQAGGLQEVLGREICVLEKLLQQEERAADDGTAQGTGAKDKGSGTRRVPLLGWWAASHPLAQ